MRNKHVAIRFSAKEHQKLVALSARLGWSQSKVLRSALDVLAGQLETETDDPRALMAIVKSNRGAINALVAANNEMLDVIETGLRLSRGAPKGRSQRVKDADEWADEHKRAISRA